MWKYLDALYIFGGVVRASAVVWGNDVWQFNLTTLTWTFLSTNKKKEKRNTEHVVVAVVVY